jgi:aminoglycoside phosphotransferase
MSQSDDESITRAESTSLQASNLRVPSENQILKLNSATLTRFTNLFKSDPLANFADYFRVEGDWYTRELRKLRPHDEIPNFGCAEGSKYVCTRDPPSLKEVLAQRPNHESFDDLINKINKHCYQNTNADTRMASKYRNTPTRHLIACVRGSLSRSRVVFRVNEDLVVKKTPLDLWHLEEAANIQHIAKWTKIPVPEIVRVHASDHTLYIFMSFVRGTELQDLWPTMTTTEKNNIATQLKIYMTELRAVKPPSPCFFGSPESRICIDSRVTSRLNVEQQRLIASEEEFNEFLMKDLKPYNSDDYYNMLLSMARVDHKVVLTHGDFHPRNIIVKDMVVTAIIDWEFAGWYPEHWEFIKALTAVGPVHDWWKYLSDIVGSYTTEWLLDRQMERDMVLRHAL